MKPIPPFEEAICKIIADTNDGLTGSEIQSLLSQCSVTDTDPGITKWKRLFNALANNQNSTQSGKHVVAFINKAMKPARYVNVDNGDSIFNNRRKKLNKSLSLVGLSINDQGKVAECNETRTVDEALKRANELQKDLQNRGVHDEILSICQARYLQKDYFYAVFEAVKTMAERLRQLTSCDQDGQALCNYVFGDDGGGKKQTPIIAFNEMKETTEKYEHYGIVKIIRGIFSAFRNPEAHKLSIYWPINKEDALDILSMVSYIHRRLDSHIDIRNYMTIEQIMQSRKTKK